MPDKGTGCIVVWPFVGIFRCVRVCVKKGRESFCRQRRKKEALSGYPARGGREETVARNCAEALLFRRAAESAGQHKKTSKTLLSV